MKLKVLFILQQEVIKKNSLEQKRVTELSFLVILQKILQDLNWSSIVKDKLFFFGNFETVNTSPATTWSKRL
jgi:hypothetical protein